MFFSRNRVDYRQVILGWLPLAVAITVMSALIAVTVQQDLRQSADDPQIQLSEDAAASLAQGAMPGTVVGPKVDIGKSLAPFLMIYDSRGTIDASSAVLAGGVPALPRGVLQAARSRSPYSVTWQPEPGVRSAIAVTFFNQGSHSGYVVAGRSLREIEKREALLDTQVLVGWAAALLLSLAAAWAVKSRR